MSAKIVMRAISSAPQLRRYSPVVGQTAQTEPRRTPPRSPKRHKQTKRTPQRDLRELYPEGAVLESGYHRVSRLHRLYYEVHGNPTGPAAVVLHGGPGAGCSATMGRLFDLTFWKVVLFDQRGCGKSVPRGLLHSNNTRKLVGDLEKLRYHLKVKKWLVLGGSHGALLALLYAQTHTSRVRGVVLRAVCLMRQKELDWVFSPSGVALKIPKGWQRFMSILEPSERKKPIKAYYNRMLSIKDPVRTQAARYWREWTMLILFSKLPQVDLRKISVKPESVFDKPVNLDRNINCFNNRAADNLLEEVEPLPRAIVQSLIEAHFFYYNKKFVTELFPVLERIDWIRHVPCIAIHGAADQICLKTNALDLKAAWKELDLRLIPKAGHSQFDPLIRDATMDALDEMKAVVEGELLETRFHDAVPEPSYQIPEPHYKKKYR